LTARSTLVAVAIGIFVSAAWVYLRTPAPDYFIVDPDGGLFIYGGWHTLRSGEQPQLDYLSHYGPLSYWLRSAALAITSGQPVAEVLLCTLGYVAAYAALLWVLVRTSGDPRIAVALLVLALLAMPRFYKFPVILIPMLSLWSASKFLERPLRGSAAVLGTIAGIAFLFRHDYGVAAAFTASLALVLARPVQLQGRRPLWLTAGVALFAVVTPWLVALAYRPGIPEYVRELWESSSGVVSGLGLSHPLLGPVGSRVYWFFAIFYALPAVGLAAAAFVWFKRRDDAAAQCSLVAMTALAYLPQSAHRADEGHLLQVIAPGFVVLACLWRIALVNRGRIHTVVATLASLAASAIVVWSAYERGWFTWQPLGATARTWQTTSSIVRTLQAPPTHPWSPGYVIAIRALDRCTRADERVVVYPYAHQITYFAGRLMPLPLFLLTPGFFDSDTWQDKVIDNLRRAAPTMILWAEEFTFDNDPLRNPTRTHARLFAFVRSAYASVGSVGPFTAYAPHDRAEAMARCLAP